MKFEPKMFAAALFVAALATGCDRTEHGPASSASPQPQDQPQSQSAPVTAPRADAGTSSSQQSPQPDAATKQEPQVQGQVDSKQPEQKKDFEQSPQK